MFLIIIVRCWMSGHHSLLENTCCIAGLSPPKLVLTILQAALKSTTTMSFHPFYQVFPVIKRHQAACDKQNMLYALQGTNFRVFFSLLCEACGMYHRWWRRGDYHKFTDPCQCQIESSTCCKIYSDGKYWISQRDITSKLLPQS